MTLQFADESAEGRYTLRQENGTLVSSAEYRDDGSIVSLTRIFTNPTFRGQGHAAEMMAQTVAVLEEKGRVVIPTCWYAAEWFDAHPDKQHLLHESARG